MDALLHKTALDRFKHLKVNYKRLLEELNIHDFADFCITAHHLQETAGRDILLTDEQKDRVEKHKAGGRGTDFLLVQAIANTEKHGQENRNGADPFIKKISPMMQQFVSEGQNFRLIHSPLPPGVSPVKSWQDGGEFIIECEDGSTHQSLGLVYRVYIFWESLFEGPRPLKTGSVPLVVFIQQELERASKSGQETSDALLAQLVRASDS